MDFENSDDAPSHPTPSPSTDAVPNINHKNNRSSPSPSPRVCLPKVPEAVREGGSGCRV